jgi:lipopolysaccharide export system permease protein
MSLMRVPDLMLQLLPFAVLLGSLIWLNKLNRWYELVALRATGLPVRRFIMGPVVACLFIGIMALVIGNPVSSTLLKRYERWHTEVFPNSVQGLVTVGGHVWLRQSEPDHEFFIYGQHVAQNGTSLGNSTVFVFSPKGDFEARVDAAQALLTDGQWRLQDVFMMSPRKDITHRDEVTLATTLTPEQIQSSFNPPGTLNVLELNEFIHVLSQSGLSTNRHAMALQRLLALPIMCVTMLMLAVPCALRFSRNRSVAVVIGMGLLLGFGFYLFGNIMAAYGMAGRLDVHLAAWLPAMMAALLAVALLLAQREE